ncbi:hypothetical protein PUN4_180086 [Paraburkholderia unamae]|nr:hypothetical protein PUN4_180086 [Paraburkholderia unamae]
MLRAPVALDYPHGGWVAGLNERTSSAVFAVIGDADLALTGAKVP